MGHQVGKGGVYRRGPRCPPKDGGQVNAETELGEDSELLGKLEQMRHSFKRSLQNLGTMGILFAVFLGLSALSRVA